VLLTVSCLMSCIFTAVGLSPLRNIPIWPVAALAPFVIIGMIIYIVRKNSEPDDTRDETPNECWSAGGVYYNPNDPAMFVPNRFGFGSTLNFANPWARTFLVVLFGGVGLLTAFLIWALR